MQRKQHEEIVIIVNNDVSGSMETPFNQTANSSIRSDAIFSSLDKIIQNTNKQHIIKIGVNLFGCILAPTCDFVKFITAIKIDESIIQIPVDQKIIDYCEINSSTYKQRLGKLGEQFGAKFLIRYLDEPSEDQCKEIYEMAIKDQNLCVQLVNNLPEKVKSGLSTVFIKGGVQIGSYMPFIGKSIGNYYKLSIQEEVNHALELCIKSISTKISCNNYNWKEPIHLNVLNGEILKEKFNEFKEKVNKVGKYPFMNWMKQFIYGNTPTYLSLSQCFEAFLHELKTRYHILFLVTDGQYNVGGDPYKCVIENLSKDELKNVIIVCCFFSSDYIDNPRQLYYKCPPGLDNYCKKLFNMSSLISVNSRGFDVLCKKYHWELPEENACHLFFQVNHPSIINEFSTIITDLINEENYFTNAFSSIYMNVIRDDHLMNQKSFDQKNEHICFAYACACTIQLSLCRIFCRDIYSFNSIFSQIVNDFSPRRKKGAYVSEVLEMHCKRYNLHSKLLENEEGARLAIASGRVCVATFWLPKKAWTKFGQFFRSNPKGILKRSDILQSNGTLGDPDEEGAGGHAVVLIDANIAALEFLNSWGPNWGNNGRFRVENADVLNMKFYDVYWTLNDLTQIEKVNYGNSIRATSEAIKNNDPDPSKYSALYFRCTHCYELIRDEKLSTSSTESICPFCHSKFNPCDSSLRRGLFEPK